MHSLERTKLGTFCSRLLSRHRPNFICSPSSEETRTIGGVGHIKISGQLTTHMYGTGIRVLSIRIPAQQKLPERWSLPNLTHFVLFV